MLRRWIIRNCFIALCVVCVATWVGSYWRFFELGYHGDIEYSGGIQSGRLGGWRVIIGPPPYHAWLWSSSRPAPWQDDADSTKFHLLGFAVYYVPSWYTTITIPLWFPTLLSAVLLWFVWRKTRPKLVGKAFPVEPNNIFANLE